MRVLAVNCGSSTLKFDVLELAEDSAAPARRLAHGLIDRVGGPSVVSFEAESGTATRQARAVPDLAAAVREAVDSLRGAGLMQLVDAVGHRIVHGGARFHEPVLIDDAVLRAIEAVGALAPLHNPPALAALGAARAIVGPELPMVATFDTAFFAGLPAVAATYALPRDLAAKHGLRRYGFHGLAHRYMVERFRSLRPDISLPRLVTFQLGNGCSVTASRDGRPLDTSMGFTPLEGLVMGTRSGDLDPALPLFIAEREGLAPADVESLLNRRSGLLGMSGRSPDMRDLLHAAAAGDERAALAVEVFCYRARKYLGAYLAVLSGADGIVFGGGIGENSAEVRARICDGMAWAGIELDSGRNAAALGAETRVSSDAASVDVWVVAVDEASIIAQDVASCLAAAG
jgi:acetate kinase